MSYRTYSVNLTRLGPEMISVSVLWHDWMGKKHNSGLVSRTRASSRHEARMQVLDALDQVIEQADWWPLGGPVGGEHRTMSLPRESQTTAADSEVGA
jgi:oligoribonuclease (3'-5' exoribonuclease)